MESVCICVDALIASHVCRKRRQGRGECVYLCGRSHRQPRLQEEEAGPWRVCVFVWTLSSLSHTCRKSGQGWGVCVCVDVVVV
eukprot:364101-Chlamydomonas_euryale.AAC.9